MNKNQLLLVIGATTASLFLSMPKENGLVNGYAHGAVLSEENYKVEKVADDKYYYTDGKTYDVLIGDQIFTFKNNQLHILESNVVEPQLIVRTKTNIAYPYSKDNPDIYDEYTLVIPDGYAYFVGEIK